MRRSTRNLLVYGGLAAAAWWLYKRSQAPAVTLPAVVPTGAAGFGYFPDGSDRPFARYYSRMRY